MVTKVELPPFWDRLTGGFPHAAAVTIRMRVFSEAGLLASRRASLTDLDKAWFIIGLYASDKHAGALDAARRVADLELAVHESGPENYWKYMISGGRFVDVLARIIRDLRLADEPPGLLPGGYELLEVAICFTRPEASISVGGRLDSTADDETYVWSDTISARHRRDSRGVRFIRGDQIVALARIDFDTSRLSDVAEAIAEHETAASPGRDAAAKDRREQARNQTNQTETT